MDNLSNSVATAEFRILLESLVSRSRKRRRIESPSPPSEPPPFPAPSPIEESASLESSVERFKTEAQLDLLNKKVASMKAELANRDSTIISLEDKW